MNLLMNRDKLIRLCLVFIALSGAFSVLFGAWLAHGAQTLMAEDKARLVTAHHYQIIHSLAALTVVLAYRVKASPALMISAILFIIGMLLFSGSLYLKTFTGAVVFAQLAPLGGITLTFGWLALAFTGIKK